MSNIKTMFSQILKSLRKQKHVTQIQLAAALGVSPGNVGDWENGKSNPSYQALIGLAEFFHVSADVLLGIRNVGEGPVEGEVLTEEEAKLVAMMRRMDDRDRKDIFDLASIKYTRNCK